jgi:hypothetical protein
MATNFQKSWKHCTKAGIQARKAHIKHAHVRAVRRAGKLAVQGKDVVVPPLSERDVS